MKLGAGETWPGEIALRIDPKITAKMTQKISGGIILVAGTNGKTTTAKMVETILRKNKNAKIIHNATGANLLNGIASTLLLNTKLTGEIAADYAIFEVDEAALPKVLKHVTPKAIVLLNLFRDQLDRYGEVDTIAKNWLAELSKLNKNSTTIINADDPHLAFIGSKINTTTVYYGIGDETKTSEKIFHATDSTYCPNCGNKLKYTAIYFSHLGEWECVNCGLKKPLNDINSREINSPLEGLYNNYNTMAAILATGSLGVERQSAQESLKNFKPAFGRMEEFEIDGKNIKIILSKNPTGFNENIHSFLQSDKRGPLLLVLNDRIPDGQDVSWIWDVDFEDLSHQKDIIASGDRAYDLGLRLKYAVNDQREVDVIADLKQAIKRGIDASTPNAPLWIMPTYSAMLDVRKIITGKKI